MSNNNTTNTTHTEDPTDPNENEKSKASRSRRQPRRRRTASSPRVPRRSQIEETSRTDTDTTRSAASTSSLSSTRNEDGGKASDASIPTPPSRSRVKRFFLKISEKMGGVEQTQYSDHFVGTCQEIDNYKDALEDLAKNLVVIAQRHPRFEPTNQSVLRMLFEYDDNCNPYETLYVAFKEYNEFLPPSGKTDVYKYLEMIYKLAPMHRSFHRRVRRCLRNIRKFLSTDYYAFNEERRVLNERRQEMDFAKHELRNAKAPEVVEMKNLVFENAQKRHEAQLQKVLQLVDSFPQMRDVHLQDVINFQAILRVYHDNVAQLYLK